MISVKKFFLRTVLVAEVVLCMWLYLFGAHGLKAITALRSETSDLSREIIALRHDIKGLQTEIAEWESTPWYSEKIAREELQLAYPTEEVFLMVKE
jgi:cell division protein FtsB